jgi:hypothetical protein
VDHGDVNGLVRAGLDEDDSIPAEGKNFRVAHLIILSIGKPQLERLKGLAAQPLSNRFRVHEIAFQKGIWSREKAR